MNKTELIFQNLKYYKQSEIFDLQFVLFYWEEPEKSQMLF